MCQNDPVASEPIADSAKPATKSLCWSAQQLTHSTDSDIYHVHILRPSDHSSPSASGHPHALHYQLPHSRPNSHQIQKPEQRSLPSLFFYKRKTQALSAQFTKNLKTVRLDRGSNRTNMHRSLKVRLPTARSHTQYWGHNTILKWRLSPAHH